MLADLGIDGSAMLGRGGEAWVYAVDNGRVARISRSRGGSSDFEARVALLEELAGGADAVPFETPEVLERRVVDGHEVSYERRFAGMSMDRALGEISGAPRERLIRAYLDATDQVGDLPVQGDDFGEFAREDGIVCADFQSWLTARAGLNLARAEADFAGLDAGALAEALQLDGSEGPSLVHCDVFPGNVMVEGARVTAIIDFGKLTIRGDRLFDPLAAVAYLDEPISPEATDRDRAVAADWLAARGLGEYLEPARRWLAAYWASAEDSAELVAWAKSVLLS